MPDGAYYLKIVASDSPSNPPNATLKTERESERFEIDNTPPVIQKLEGGAAGVNAGRSMGVAHNFQFTAMDATSGIGKAQYSVGGGEWVLLAPAQGVSDSKTES